jgi:MerR family transcriptional regulator, light-induced transcriptional regulator
VTLDEEPHGELLTLHEAADRLKVHYMTAYRWVRRGDLPAFKAGGRLRVRAGDLTRFVEDEPTGPST